MSLRICFAASEVAPLAKTGGLADVSAALTKYLAGARHDVRLFMPLHAQVDRQRFPLTPVPTLRALSLTFAGRHYTYDVHTTPLPGSSALVYLIDCPALFERERIYTEAPDEALRFIAFTRAVIESCQHLGFAPHIFHCNDWHTAFAPLLLKAAYEWDILFRETRSVLTIHNIGYQGEFSATSIDDIGLTGRNHLLHQADLARGRINSLKHGLMYADSITTVSPTYAREICTDAYGMGMQQTLRARGDALIGILNGVDYDEWDPRRDRHLPQNYDARSLKPKAAIKAALLERSGLAPAPSSVTFGIVSRLTVQKGFDLLFDTLPARLESQDIRLVALGNGDALYEKFFTDLQRRFPQRVAFQRGYDDALAHWIEAGSDAFLMPSLYEPCGLNQMYSLRYGTVPIVRKTGGLADSVQHFDPATGNGTGIVFNDFDAPAMAWAIDTAIAWFADAKLWRKLVRNGMRADFSWRKQGAEYVALYERLTAT